MMRSLQEHIINPSHPDIEKTWLGWPQDPLKYYLILDKTEESQMTPWAMSTGAQKQLCPLG